MMDIAESVILLATVLFSTVQVLCKDKRSDLFGPNCLSCTGVRNSSDCLDKTHCWGSEQCYTERYQHIDGQTLYDFGCKVKEECALIEASRERKKRLDITIDLCEECCHGELCNANTCVKNTEKTQITCYTCEGENSPNNCKSLQQCNNDEMCYAETVLTHGSHPVFTMGCVPKKVCLLLENGAQTIIGRSTGKSPDKRATHLCQKCCSTSGCNNLLCEAGEVTEGEVTASLSTTESMATLNPHTTLVRLEGGQTPHEGRVEIFYSGSWGTVCDDTFDANAASVVCGMLGFPRSNAVVHRNAHFGSGTGNIWLDGVWCTGSENNIAECEHSSVGNTDCTHSEDVGVTCSGASVRLVGGLNSNEGRLEIFHSGSWGTICDSDFHASAASVACHMLGFPRSNARVVPHSEFGSGTGIVWLQDVRCTGEENIITDCQHSGWANTNCAHNRDVGVTCAPAMRLVGGMSSNEGRLEVFYSGSWGTVCNDNFDVSTASVVCHTLGFPRSNARVHPSSQFGSGSGDIWLDEMRCTGTENNIAECQHSGWGSVNCGHNDDVGVTCAQAQRLIGGVGVNEGTLEIFHNGTWGTVCGLNFDDSAASVVCGTLGFPRANSIVHGGAYFGRGSGNIWLRDVRCTGTENGVADCQHSGWNITSCSHYSDIGVTCAPSLRLVGSVSSNKGRVEMLYNGTWGTVCGDKFDASAASVVCHMLGFPRTNARVEATATFGSGRGNVWLEDVKCTGTENNINDCRHSGWGNAKCGHNTDVGVSCDQAYRLVGGNDVNEGRLEIFYNGTWGTVCGSHLDVHTASVACHTLGFLRTNATAHRSDHFGRGTGIVWLHDVRCTGTENRIADCRHGDWGSTSCSHSSDVGVTCAPTAARLVGGEISNEGRLEVFYKGSWGTVCDNNFNASAASVVCHMLGFLRTNATMLPAVQFGNGSGRIWLDDVRCTGEEDIITDCQHKPWGFTDCSHSEDVGVTCAPAVRLVDGKSSNEGRVEILYKGSWGTVCDDYFSASSASVVCHMLRFPRANATVQPAAHFGRGTGTVWLNEVRCSGFENSITDCQHKGWGNINCRHNEDVGVTYDGSYM